MMQSGGGNPMNAAQLARLQQQLAQYGQQGGQQPQQQQQQQLMNNMGGAMGNPQQLQQAFLQQQQQLQQNQGGMAGVRRSSQQLAGMGNNAALAMMQQQQQQQQVVAGNSPMANANMSSYWNALQQGQGNVTGAMDASNASSVQLAALAGMNMQVGNTNNNNNGGGLSLQQQQNNAMLLGQRSQSQGQQQLQNQQVMSGMGGLGGMNSQGNMGGNQGGLQGLGQTNDASILQQQIAQLQRQLQQQQQNQQQNSMGMQGMNRRQTSTGSFQQQMQQQNNPLFQQMQQLSGGMMGGQDGMGQQQNEQFSMMMQGGSQNQPQQMGISMGANNNNLGGSQGGVGGRMTEQEMLMQQQQQLMRASGMQQNPHADLMGRRSQDLSGSMNSQHQNNNAGGGLNAVSPLDMDGSMGSQRSNRIIMGSNDGSGDKGGLDDPANKSFLDGSFAGGWQSNADLPDRRRIIFSILEVIRQMRPDTNKISQKLPHMAKSLEEHLYRSAQSKEEYLDQSTLKKRLQLIAHGLELHRSSSTGDQSNNQGAGMSSDNQQFQQFMQMQQGNNQNSMQGGQLAIPGMIGSGDNSMNQNSQMEMLQGLVGSGGFGGNDASIDRIAAQKKKVIRQQQQRLLLLRHASKCKLGQNCSTKFCSQMTTLWKHMKKCRDKNCKTSHCLSSRCVLNHYRICKSQGRTATCEVCGPVMEQIKRQDASEGMDGSMDPLAAKPDPDLPSAMGSERQMSVFGQDVQQNAQSAQQQVMQQLYQQQQQAIQQQGNQMGGFQGNQMNQMQQLQNFMQGMGDNMQGNMVQQSDSLSGSQQGPGSNDPQQLQQLQDAQQKLHQQQQVLKQLQKQQAQLLEQQRQLQEQQQQGQQGQQLQQQHALLQQLQRRCQQQQALIQQELIVTMKGIQQQQNQQGQGNNSSMGSQVMGNSSQHSHHSQHSQHSHHSHESQQNQNNQAMMMQNMQGNQIQGMSQMLIMNGGSQNQVSMGVMQNQMQNLNQMQGQMNESLNNDLSDEAQHLQDLEASLDDNDDPLSQALVDDSQADDMQESMKSSDEQDISQQDEAADDDESAASQNHAHENESTQPVESGSQALDDNSNRSTGSKPKPNDSISGPSPPSPPRVPRGRGGKGKRLREIADDLMPGPGAATSMEEGSRKRNADEIGGENGGEQGSKSQKTDGPIPDTEKSGGQNTDAEGSSSLASSMPKGDVEQHLLMLHKGLHLTSRTITHKCLPIVQQLIDDPYGWVFRDAVDPVVFGLPDYFEVVKNPMHLLLVKKKLENAVYTDMASFERDVKLVFENAILYNGEESEVGTLAKTMMGVFEKEYKKVCEETSDIQSIDPDACTLCGKASLKFEPPVLYCSGMSCGMSRIKRNAVYYADAKDQNFWCKTCYSDLKPNELIMLDDGSEIRKSRLISAKHDSLPEESFLECSDCHARVHQICALFNSRKATRKHRFRCPKCILVQRSVEPKKVCEAAKDLPKCKMSDYIESGLSIALEKAYEKRASELGVDAAAVEKVKGLSVRVVSHVKKKHAVRDEMYKMYSTRGCPADFPVHTKCVGLFQTIDGLDVLLFAMYLYEYHHDCPAPNRRRVYISYLDSVKYFEPKCYRTLTYQSMIIEYLRYVKMRGFHTAHIWSCPPAPGDEYVFHCHPPQQKVPPEDMLRHWYYDVLDMAKKEGIVIETSDFHEEFFKDGGINSPIGSAPDPTSLPYFEGDYIPGEIETIVSNLNKEGRKAGKQGSYDRSPAPVPKRVASGLRSGTRSNPGQLLNQYQDRVMNRLANAIYNMKENLIVARLRNKQFVAAVERGDDVSEWPDDDSFIPDSVDSQRSDSDDVEFEEEEESASVDGSEKDDGVKKERTTPQSTDNSMHPVPSAKATIGSTLEEDEQFESEMFENRQLFLNYCQTNHCQFDEMRRAKHSTMMVLFQLHNPTAPKFVQQCGACHRDIVSGNKFHCNVCPNFDLCQDCYLPFATGGRTSRFIHERAHTFSRISFGASVNGAEARNKGNAKQEDKTKTLNAYLEVLSHAAHCEGPPSCRLNNCVKMKQLFVHVQTCQTTHSFGCKICARLLSLIIVHARSCTVRGEKCPLPYCDKIRERNERLRRHQLYMDDRRRQAQNAFYHAGEG